MTKDELAKHIERRGIIFHHDEKLGWQFQFTLPRKCERIGYFAHESEAMDAVKNIFRAYESESTHT